MNAAGTERKCRKPKTVVGESPRISEANAGYVPFQSGAPKSSRGSSVAIFLATLVAMTSSADHMSLAEVKNHLSEVVDRLEREHGRVVITKHGRPAAVVLSIEDLEGLEETLDILSNPGLMRRIRKADAEISAGEDEPLSKAQLLDLVQRK